MKAFQVQQFEKFGPILDGVPLFQKFRGQFSPVRGLIQDKYINDILRKIAAALNAKNFADAAIRFAHVKDSIEKREANALFKANFNPSQPRNANGEWSEVGEAKTASEEPKGTPSPGYCKIVKQLCITSSIDKLPTGDFGFRFWNAVNACMDSYGCLGRA